MRQEIKAYKLLSTNRTYEQARDQSKAVLPGLKEIVKEKDEVIDKKVNYEKVDCINVGVYRLSND